MGHAKDRIAIATIDCAASRASQKMVESIGRLYGDVGSASAAECPRHVTIDRSEDDLGQDIENADRKPSIAVVYWDDSRLPAVAPMILGTQAALAGIDLSSVDPGRRGAASAPLLRGLASGTVDMVLFATMPSFPDPDALDSDFVVIRVPGAGMQLTAITNRLSLGALLAGDAAKLLPLEVGLSLQEVRFVDGAAAAGREPGEPYRRTLRKLRLLGIACIDDGPVGTVDRIQPEQCTFRLTPGPSADGAPDRPSVTVSCNEPAEPCAWLSLSGVRGPSSILSVANSLLGVIATPEPEWQRWSA
jgi:hypothetical protein